MADRNATIQRKRERFFFEEFASKAGLDAEIIEQPDAPDIIASISGDVVGVEITEFFVSDESHGGTPQAQESLGDRIVAKAQRLYEESGAPAAHVSICFAPGRSISHLDRDDTAIRIAGFVRRLNLATWQTENWRPAISKAPLPSEISFIHALGVPEYDMAHWCVARAGWVAPLKAESLQLRVNAKATRLEAYRGVIKKVWLLVVADTGRPSSLVDLERDFDPRVIDSPYDRTYFFRLPDTVVEVAKANGLCDIE